MRRAFATALGALACLAIPMACGTGSRGGGSNADAAADALGMDSSGDALGEDAPTSPDSDGDDATTSEVDDSPGEAQSDSPEEDVSFVNAEDVVWCKGSVRDAGFSSLSQFPFAAYCAGPYPNTVFEATTSCQGTLIVGAADGSDCGLWWLFDATTGALEATGGGCNGGWSCGGAAPGFKFPYQCFINGGWEETDPCFDAGSADATGQ